MALIFYRETPMTRSLKVGAIELVLWIFAGIALGAAVEKVGLPVLANLVVLVVFAGYPVYVAISTERWGGTLAKRVGGVRVVSRHDGQRPSRAQAWTRVGFQALEFLLCLCTGPIAFGWLLFTRRRHGGWWHDHRAGTRLEWSSGS